MQETFENNQRKMVQMYEDDIGRIRDAVDSRLAELRNVGDRLYQSKWVSKLSSETDTFEKEFDVLRKLEIRQELNNYMAFSGVLSNMAVVFPYKDLVVSHSGWYNIEDYFESTVLGEQCEFDNIYSNMLDYNYFKIIESSQSKSSKNTSNYLAIIQSMELHEKPRAVLLLFVDIEYLTAYIKQIAGPGLKELSVFNENKTIFNYNFRQLTEIDNFNNQSNCLSLKAASNISSWKYICTYDNNYIPFKTEQLIPLLSACMLSLAAGILAAYILARVTYKPLYKLLNKVFKQDDFVKTNNIKVQPLHEYKLIATSFDKLVTEKETIMRRVKNYENAARWNLLLRLLKGYFEDDNLIEKLLELGINYSNDNSYCVVLINEEKKFEYRKTDVEDQADAQKYRNHALAMEKQMRLNLIVAVDDVLDAADIEYQLLEALDDDIAVIISVDNPEKNDEYIQKIIEKILNRIEASSNIKPLISAGNIEKGIIGISKSYQVAKGNIECAIFGIDILGNPKIITEGGFYYYPTDWEIQLINNLKVGNLDTVTRIIEEIKLENENRKLSSDSMVRLISLIMETIIRVFNELNINVKIYQKEFKSKVASGDIVGMWLYLYELCNRICDRSKYANDSESIRLSETLLQYVNDNYSDSNISLKELSEVFNMPVSSISKLFKEASGINYYDYICRLRMEKAKELLKDIGYDVENIASAVGYENEYSFKRAFLRYEGIRPRDYALKVVQEN